MKGMNFIVNEQVQLRVLLVFLGVMLAVFNRSKAAHLQNFITA